MAPRVLVIGAGFAGLAAAWTLRQRGAEVVVLEARDRVGGRVHSTALADGSVVELGAEFILPPHDTVRRFTAELGLELYEKGTLYGNREPRGGPPVEHDELTRALDLAERAASDGEPLPAALAGLGIGAGAREAIIARIEVSTAYPAADQASAILADGASRFGDFPSHGVAGGNQRLATAIADRLGDGVELEARVERVAYSPRAVTVTAAGGEVTGDACVVAAPASVLGRIVFDPPLPGWKLAALEAVRYGQAAKLFLPLARAAPPSAVLSVPGRFWTYTQRAPGGADLPVACSFAGSPAAVARLDAATWAAEVRALRPDLVFDDAAEAVLSTWAGDPWALGAYSARSLSSPLDDAALAAPVECLSFAGEHTAGEYHALMEGALRSGVRAASEVAGPS
jgi:monoamine oxidase